MIINIILTDNHGRLMSYTVTRQTEQQLPFPVPFDDVSHVRLFLGARISLGFVRNSSRVRFRIIISVYRTPAT